jgi:hypothetical protein
MDRCISRRAHADKYNFRLINGDKQGKYIWTEFRCPNAVSGDRTVCEGCSKKLPNYKYQSTQKCDHGVVGGPYPTDSKLYGSPFYVKQLKEGFYPSEADERRAKEAVAKAISDMPKKKVIELAATAVIAELAPTADSAIKVEKVEKVPKKPRTVKLKKAPLNTTVITEHTPISEPLKVATMVESMEAPIHISDVVVVKVRKIKHKSKEYYFDHISRKLYGASSEGVGAYVGRYNQEAETLNTDFPDSDLEVE